MKILFYNWVQFDDWKLRGGGVSVYLTNTIDGILKVDPSTEIYFLSGGQHYTLFNRDRPFISPTKNKFSSLGVKSFRLMNSPVKAPAHDMFCSVAEAQNSPTLKRAFFEFIKKYGPFDIIHFHNIEGLSTDVFSLKKEFPNTKFFLTAHNYHIICPQIELFQNRSTICKDFHCGSSCVDCIGHKPNVTSLKRWQALGSFIELRKQEGKPLGNFIWCLAVNGWNIFKSLRYIARELTHALFSRSSGFQTQQTIIQEVSCANSPQAISDEAIPYLLWRQNNLRLVNHFIDKVIAVSDQTKQVLVDYGVDENKTVTLLNGLDFHNNVETAKKLWRLKRSHTLRLAFFGYPIPSKGLDILLDALEKLEPNLLSKTELLIASRLDAKHSERIEKIRPLFKSIYIVAGYNRNEIPSLASTVSLGIIPSVWLETYCQAGAELISFGTPVLVSNTVGIKSLIKDNKYIFQSGDTEDLIEKLTFLLENPDQLDDFWNQVEMPMSEIEHADKLLQIYQKELNHVC